MTGTPPISPAPPTVHPAAPPTTPGAMVIGNRPAAWPNVIGTLSIVLGALGLFSGLMQVVSPILSRMFASMMQAEDHASMASALMYPEWQWALGILTMLVACMLAAAGTLTLLRRRWGPRLLWVWIAARLINVGANAALTAVLQTAQMDAMAEQGSTSPAAMAGLGASMFATLVFVIGWGLAYPTFLGVWLVLPRARNEIRGWKR